MANKEKQDLGNIAKQKAVTNGRMAGEDYALGTVEGHFVPKKVVQREQKGEEDASLTAEAIIAKKKAVQNTHKLRVDVESMPGSISG